MITQQQINQLRDAWQTQVREATSSQYSTNGKSIAQIFILDCAATPSYVREVSRETYVRNITNQVQTPGGIIKTTKMATIPIKISKKTANLKAIVQKGLTRNLLSAAQIVESFGPILLMKKGATIVDQAQCKTLQDTGKILAQRNKNSFIFKTWSEGQHSTTAPNAIYLGARPQINSTTSEKHNTDNRTEKVATKHNTRTTNKTTLPPIKNKKPTVFTIPEVGEPEPKKNHRYEWHLILNHDSPDVLTKLARNHKSRDEGLDKIETTQHDLTCRPCLEFKMKMAPHHRAHHNYLRGGAVCTDILGPVNVPGILAEVERYFISFMHVATRYAYVDPLTTRAETPGLIDQFLTNMGARFGRPPDWMISYNAGEYMSKVV